MGLFRRRAEKRAASPPQRLFRAPGINFADILGRVDEDAALRLSAVWASVRLLSDTLSTLPVDVFRPGSAGSGWVI